MLYKTCLYNKNVVSLQRNEQIMNWNELLKKVKAAGYEFDRHGSRHDIYRHPQKKDYVQIERHWSQEVRPKLMKKILGQIGELSV